MHSVDPGISYSCSDATMRGAMMHPKSHSQVYLWPVVWGHFPFRNISVPQGKWQRYKD